MNNLNGKQKILLVDDIPENLDILVAILSSEYKTIATTDGEKALQIASSLNKPDLILLDVTMPGLDGYEICRRLKENISTKKIPVIFVTARYDTMDEQKGFELGAVDYITKPVRPPIVLARVRTHLALYDQNRFLETKVRKRTEELNQTRYEIIRRLGLAAEFKDNATGMHVIRMSHYCKFLGIEYGMGEEEADILHQASPMHDVGKIGIPDQILQKPGKLNDQEWETMKNHTVFGAKIIGEHNNELLRYAKIIALTHHEKWDGSGYPAGLTGEKIPVMGRIVSLADVFDALISERPYKKAWSVDRILSFFEENRAKHFDPDLVSIFVNKFDELYSITRQFADDTLSFDIA